MSTVTCTPAGASDTSYVGLERADEWMSDSEHRDLWASVGADARSASLILATNQIDRCGGPRSGISADRAGFHGQPWTIGQSLFFPRAGDVDADGDMAIPPMIEEACLRQAAHILGLERNRDPIDADGMRAQGISSVSLDGMGIEWNSTRRPHWIGVDVWDLLAPHVIAVRRTTVR